MGKLKSFLIQIYDGLYNIINWFPVIWKDRDWDYYFIYVILHKKLSNMENHMRNDAISIDSEKYADQIQKCVKILNRLIKSEYSEVLYKEHDEKWGPSNFHVNEKTGELTFNRKNIKNEEDRKKESKEYMKLAELEGDIIQYEINTLFDTMKKHIQWWWD